MKCLIVTCIVLQIVMIGWLYRHEKKLNYLNRVTSFQLLTDTGKDEKGLAMWNKLESEKLIERVVNWGCMN